MLANLIRAQLALELSLYLILGAWLHGARGWSAPLVLAALVALALGVRLALVVFSTSVSWLQRSPRPAEHQLDLAGTARLVLGEWRAMLADNLFFLPFEGLALRPDAEPVPTDELPVLLVHGYFSNRGMLHSVVQALEAAGVRPIFTFNFRGVFAPIDAFTPQLEDRVAEVLRKTGQPRLVLVCHSMGGLIARAWMAERGPDRVAKLITIASPHNGTALAALGLGANAGQMRRDSEFLAELRRREGERGPGIPVTSIYSLHDNLVAPQDTSRLPWARNVEISGLGHIDILLAARLHRTLVEELREAGVACHPREGDA